MFLFGKLYLYTTTTKILYNCKILRSGISCTQVSICGHVIPNHISMPSRSQTRVAQVLKSISKSNQKEISSSAKARIKYVQSEKETNYKPLPLSIKQSGAPILQLFARRSGAGPWAMFLERVVETELFDLSAKFYEGGISAEIVRSDIECYVAQQIFGKGLGDPPILEEVRKVLPHFSKLKPRLFEFGFKIFSIDESGPVNTLARSMTKLPTDREDFNILHQEPANLIDIESVIMGTEKLNNCGHVLQAQISSFVANIYSSNATEILISSDGSAWMRGSRCVDASAGIVFYLPTLPTGQESAVVECDKDGDDYDNGVFESVFEASNQEEEEAKPFASSPNSSFMLRVGAAGGMVSTPFDAELIACLAAITVARIIADALSKNRDTGAQGNSQEDSSRPLPTVRFVFRTDSRSLCRAVRSRKLSVAASEKEEEEAESTMDSISLVQANRRCLWDLMMKHVDQTNLTVAQYGSEKSPGAFEYSLQWSAGHPERRESVHTRWNLEETMIWLADEIAKPLRQRGRSDTAKQLSSVFSTVSELDATEMLAVSAAMTFNRLQQ